MSNIASGKYNPALLTIPSIHLTSLPYKARRVAQWKRAGPITQRSVDLNHALLTKNILICIGNLGIVT